MARDDVSRRVINGIDKNGKGRPYENLMAEAMAAYCVKNDIPYRTVTGTEEDKFRGTDFRVYGMLDIWTSNAGILRLDFTSAFSHKDNMPLIWMPMSPTEQIKRKPLRYGIRTGNKTAGFQEPVVVVGIDASRNENPDDDVDVELLSGRILSNTVKLAPAILFESGQALAAYAYASELRYKIWVDQTITDGDEELWQPDTTGLFPNYDTTRENLSTRRPTYVTMRGLSTAQEFTMRHAASMPERDPEHKAAMDHWRILDKLLQPNATRIAPPKMPWMEQLNRALEKMDGDDKNQPSDGLTR